MSLCQMWTRLHHIIILSQDRHRPCSSPVSSEVGHHVSGLIQVEKQVTPHDHPLVLCTPAPDHHLYMYIQPLQNHQSASVSGVTGILHSPLWSSSTSHHQIRPKQSHILESLREMVNMFTEISCSLFLSSISWIVLNALEKSKTVIVTMQQVDDCIIDSQICYVYQLQRVEMFSPVVSGGPTLV